MDFYTFIIGFSGILLSGISLIITYFTFKSERTVFYRQMLYEKQFDICIKVFDLATKQIGNIMMIYQEENTESRQNIIREAIDLSNVMYELNKQSEIIFPKETFRALNFFHSIALDEINYLESSQKIIKGNENALIDASEELQLSLQSLLIAIRKLIGTDSLNKVTLQSIGKANSYKLFSLKITPE